MDLKTEKAKSLTKNQVFEELNKYFKEESFKNPAWSEQQAFNLGLQKAFTKILNHLPDQEK